MLSRLFSLFSKRSANIENPATSLSDPLVVKAILGGEESDTGVPVSRDAALAYASVWQAVNLIANDVAKLPLHCFKRVGNGRERDNKHPSSWLVNAKANQYMTCSTFRQTLTAHAMLHGNGYAYVVRDSAERPIELLILPPETTEPRLVDGEVIYFSKIGGRERPYSPADILHVRGLGFDGLRGQSVLKLARNSFGLALAAEKFGAKFFRNGAKSSGVLTYPGKLSPKASENLRTTFDKTQAGVDNVGRTIILEEGAKYQALTIAPDDAQFLQTRKFQRQEIASWFGLPPHKLGDEVRTSFSSLEISNQDYLDSALSPWLQVWQWACWDVLLTEEQKRQDTHYFEFCTGALLQTDIKSRYEVYGSAVQNGLMTRNECRRRENLDDLGPEGDLLTIQANMMSLGQASVAPSATDTTNGVRSALLKVVEETAGRMVRRLSGIMQRAGAKSLDTVLSDYEPVFRDAFGSLIAAARASGSNLTMDDLATAHLASVRAGLVESKEIRQLTKQVAESWKSK